MKKEMNVHKIYLSKEDVEKLRALDPLIEHAYEELERAKKVGIDVSDLKEELDAVVKLRDALIEEYSPPEF